MPHEDAWTVIIPPRVEKTLKSVVPAREQRRLRGAIDQLQGGLVGDVKRLQGTRQTYRRRVGNWRILFDADFTARQIDILRIAQRGRAYRD